MEKKFRILLLIVSVSLFSAFLYRNYMLTAKQVQAVPGQLNFGTSNTTAIQYMKNKVIYQDDLFFGEAAFPGMITSQGYIQVGTTGAPTSGYLLNVTNGRIKTDGANSGISIGTTDNQYKLEVAGDAGYAARIAGNIGIGPGVIGQGATNSFDVPLTIKGPTPAAGSTNMIKMYDGSNTTNMGMNASALTLDKALTSSGTGKSSFAGNLGIGTTNPNQMLEIRGPIANNPSLLVAGNDTATMAYLQAGKNVSDAGSMGARVVLIDAGTNGVRWDLTNGGIAAGSLTLRQQTNSIDAMTLLPNGNVGVGITNPAARMDIGGTSSLIANTSGNLNLTPAVNLIVTQGNVGIGGAPTDKLEIASGNLKFTSGAGYTNVIGTTDGTLGNFKISGAMGGSDYWSIYGDGAANAGVLHIKTGDDGTEPIQFEQNANVSMLISSTGNVGIGTTSATSPLTVDGKVETGMAGTVGTYDSTKVQGIWSIGRNYGVDLVGNTFGTQYGMVYAHTNAGTGGANQPIANYGHQIDFVSSGTVNAAVSLTGQGYFASNVGIGTSAPGAKLQVVGKTYLGGTPGSTSTYGTSIGDTGTDNAPSSGNWNYTLTLNALNTSSIGFHDAGSDVGSIRYSARTFTIGADDGWGTASTNFGGNMSSPYWDANQNGAGAMYQSWKTGDDYWRWYVNGTGNGSGVGTRTLQLWSYPYDSGGGCCHQVMTFNPTTNAVALPAGTLGIGKQPSYQLDIAGNNSYQYIINASAVASGPLTSVANFTLNDSGQSVYGYALQATNNQAGLFNRAIVGTYNGTGTSSFGIYGSSSAANTGGVMGYSGSGTGVIGVGGSSYTYPAGTGVMGAGTSYAFYGFAGKSYFNGEVQATLNNGSGQFRAVAGNFGFFIRNDGSNSYFLLTANGDPYGSWNGLRPLTVNNTSGYVTFANGHGDLAEQYKVNGTVLRGSLISISDADKMTTVAADKSNNTVIGVVSTLPGAIMDVDGGFVIGPPTKMKYTDEKAPIALQGTAPTLVTSQNGTIAIGDAIAVSSIPGYGAKAVKAGLTVGRSLEALNTGNCKQISSVADITWPDDDGRNSKKPCYQLPDGTYVGKVVIALGPTWYDPDLAMTSTGDLNITDVNNNGNYQVKASSGSIIDRIGAFAELIVGKIKAGVMEVQKLIVNGVDVMKELDATKQDLAKTKQTVADQSKRIDQLESALRNLMQQNGK